MLSGLLLAALSFTAADAQVAYAAASNLVAVATPRDAGTSGGRRAADWLCRAVAGQGLAAEPVRFRERTPCGEMEFVNVVAESMSVTNGEWTVLVSHFDTKRGSGCPGANDGAATCGLLVAFAGILARSRCDAGNVMLLWTDGEECFRAYGSHDGLWGSRHAARMLKASGRKVSAVICLDMLGDRDLQLFLPKNGTPSLRQRVLEAAAEVGMSRFFVPSDVLVKDDHVPFLETGFPAVDLIDFEYGSSPGANDYWHTPADTIDKLSAKSLEIAGRVVAALLSSPPVSR